MSEFRDGQNDGTVRILRGLGLPVTRENYIRLACAGNPAIELDGEIESMLDDVQESLPDGQWEDTTLPLTNRDRELLRHMGISAVNE